MFIYTIKLESREDGEKITEVLIKAEENGDIDFAFGAHLSDEVEDDADWFRHTD